MSELLTNIVKKQRAALLAEKSRTAGKLIQRIKSQELKRLLESPIIKIILGPRRAGKSTLALQALDNCNFAYFNFEDEGLPLSINGQDLIEAITKVYGKADYYFFDEIQNFPRWEQFLNRLHRENKNLIVTGSNAHLLSDELASALTGRHAALEVLPFNFSEVSDSKNHAAYDLDQFLIRGGFPEVVLNKVDYRIYLATLWDSVILKDIVQRKKIRNISGLSDVLSLFLSAIGSRLNVDSICRQLGGSVSAPTAKKFLEYGEQAYLIQQLQVYNPKLRLRIKTDRKAYVVDNGFYNSKCVKSSPDHGALLENLVFNELRVRGFRPNDSLFYYVTRSGFEIDFLLRAGHLNSEAIQVSHNLSSLKTRERELRALSEAAAELSLDKLKVITKNENKIETYKNTRIEIISIEEWLKARNT